MEILEAIYEFFRKIIEDLRFRIFYGPVFHRFLNYKYTYYTLLPPREKIGFLQLVRDHYEYFEFAQRQMTLTRAMKAIICSGASQLVLKLPPESLTYFERIIVYPDYYNSLLTRKTHKGEVNPGLKTIVFSWRGIIEGLDRKNDGLNLLLHEFAHALWLEHKLTAHEYEVLDPELVQKFEKLAVEEMKHLAHNENHFFRKYAFENMDEFFAVSVENFFERPVEFSSELPSIFSVLVSLLKQNPIHLKKQ